MKGFIVISAKLIGYNNASWIISLTSREIEENARTFYSNASPHDSEHQIMQVTLFITMSRLNYISDFKRGQRKRKNTLQPWLAK